MILTAKVFIPHHALPIKYCQFHGLMKPIADVWLVKVQVILSFNVLLLSFTLRFISYFNSVYVFILCLRTRTFQTRFWTRGEQTSFSGNLFIFHLRNHSNLEMTVSVELFSTDKTKRWDRLYPCRSYRSQCVLYCSKTYTTFMWMFLT
jgi:hypothetical protein